LEVGSQQLEAREDLSIGHLLDHVSKIWTRTEALDQYRSSTRTYLVSEGNEAIPCTATRKRTVLGKIGGGSTPLGDRVVYFDIGPVMNEGDVIELIEGPDSPAKLEIQGLAYPRDNHIEARVSEFKGNLENAES
jgi:hypothetical protein